MTYYSKYMHKFYHKHALILSLIIFVLSLAIAGDVFAFGKPAAVGSNAGTTPSNPGSSYVPQYNTTQQATSQQNTGSGYAPTTIPQGRPSVSPVPNSMQQQGQSHVPAFAQVHLQGGKLQACEAVSQALTTRSNHLVGLVDQQFKTFASIAVSVEQYYLTKAAPSGTTLSNYDALVSEITTTQNAVATPLQAAQNDITNFSCTGNNPAAQMTQFNTDMRAVLTALQAYRTSIKNLIVALVSLPTPSTTPTVSPSVSPVTTVSPSVTP